MEHRITKEDEQAISKASAGLTLKDLSRRLVEAVNPDRHTERAKLDAGLPADSTKPISEQAIAAAATKLIKDAVTPLHDPKLRELLIDAIRMRDYPIVQSLVLLFALMLAVVNLLIDLLCGLLDPRIRHE